MYILCNVVSFAWSYWKVKSQMVSSSNMSAVSHNNINKSKKENRKYFLNPRAELETPNLVQKIVFESLIMLHYQDTGFSLICFSKHRFCISFLN